MAFTTIMTYTGDGATNNWSISYNYLKKSHVKMYLDGVEDTTFSWLTDSSVAATSTPGVGVAITIQRETPRDVLDTVIPASGTIRGADLNNQAYQALYVAEEGYDALVNVLSLDDTDDTWDASSKIIKNVATPTADHHAARKDYVDAVAGSATAAAASAAAAAVSASQASSSATSAASSASAAASSASAASTSATNALASENAAETAETNAAASAAAAATSETNAAASETAAASSASAASTSETNAAASETAAAASASAASTSETNAAASYDAFDDRYLGSKASAPTLDNDGDPLVAGAIYWNTGTNSLWFYNGSAWEDPVADADTSATNAATSETNAAASAAAASTSETNAASSASAASTSATNAATSETNAASSASAASTSASNAATSETNAASSASAASTSASNAATSETNASTSASNAATSETNAAASFDAMDDRFLGTKASDPTLDNDGDPLVEGAMYYNSTSNRLKFYNGSTWDDPQTATATSESNAATSASNAATSETNAATSETNAATSASNAATSASNAASDAASAAASWDLFDDTYLGAKASDPTLDNDGDALVDGTLYWNTTSDSLRIYNAGAWEAAAIPVSGGVTYTGTPVDNQLAVWTSAGVAEGDANLTWDGSTLATTGEATVSDTFTANDHIWHTGGYSVATATYVPIEWKNGVTTLDTGYSYKVSIVTTGTSTDTGAVYLVDYNDNTLTWDVRAVHLSGTTSNHPLLRENAGVMEIYHNHASTYSMRVHVESRYWQEDAGVIGLWGSESFFQSDTGQLIHDRLTGIQYGTGSDVDVSLLKVDVTGAPELFWDESLSTFKFSNHTRTAATSYAEGFLSDSTYTNSDPGTDNAWFTGYGIMGNRGSFYMTNANATGNLVFGTGGVHAANNRVTINNNQMDLAVDLYGQNVDWYMQESDRTYFDTDLDSYFTVSADDSLKWFTGGTEALALTNATLASYRGLAVQTGNAFVYDGYLMMHGRGAAAARYMYFDTDAGQYGATFYRGGAGGATARWLVGKNNTTESGSNAGGDFVFIPYNDAGTTLGTALQITRSNYAAYFSGIIDTPNDVYANDLVLDVNGRIYFDGGGDTYMVETSANIISVYNGGVRNWAFTGSANYAYATILPINSSPLGSATYRWSTIYGTAGDFASTITAGSTIETTGGVLRSNRIGDAAESGVYLDGDAGTNRIVRFRTGTSMRWAMVATNAAETGSDAGSDFSILRYSDAAASATVVSISRATGLVSFTNGLSVSDDIQMGGWDVTGIGQLNFNATAASMINLGGDSYIGISGADPWWVVDAGDYYLFDQADNGFRWVAGGTRNFEIRPTYVEAPVGAFYLGVNDTTQGVLSVYGNSTTSGGLIELYLGATADTTTNKFSITGDSNGNLAFQEDGTTVVHWDVADVALEVQGQVYAQYGHTNATTISANKTVSGAGSIVGPVAISDTYTLTVASGARLVIL